MKPLALLLCFTLCFTLKSAEQTADVVSYQPTTIEMALPNTALDLSGGTLPILNNFVNSNPSPPYLSMSSYPIIGRCNADNSTTEFDVSIDGTPSGTVAFQTFLTGRLQLIYTPKTRTGDSIVFVFKDRATSTEVARRVLQLNVINTPPVITCETQLAVRIGEKLTLSASATDPDGDSTTITYDGDSSPVKTFGAAGVYTVNVTATDALGAQSTRPVTVVVNSADGRSPTARFTTSDVVGFVGQPIGFDAFFSTDPQNQIVAYTWDFGDSSPKGSGQAISKIYSAVGTYDVTLAITDADGITAKTVRTIEVLPADQLGLFNSEFSYTVRFNRAKNNTDTLILNATVNTGAEPVLQAGTVVALEIAGQRFEASLDNRLRAKVGNTSFTVKSGLRRQAAGQADVSVRVTKATLGLGFNTAGAVDDGDHLVTVDIPVRVEIGGLVFEVPIESDFHFSASGQKATGKGNGP